MDKPMPMSKPRQYSNFNLYLITCAVNLISISVGSAMTWTSPTLPKLLEPNDRITVTPEEGAWIASLFSLGACFGPLFITLIVDLIGKKLSLLLCALAIFIHWVIIAMVNSLQAIYVARFLVGIATGINYNLIPVYIAEISPDDIRGLTGSFLLPFVYVGCCISYVVGPYTSILTLIMVLGVIPLIAMPLFLWIPESPYYLMANGRKQQTSEALQYLRTYPDDQSVIQQEMDEIQTTLDKSNIEKLQNNEPWIKRITRPGIYKPIYYSCMLVTFQQMCGFGAILFYAEFIFKKASPLMPSSIAAIICGLVMVGSGILIPFMGKLFRIKNVLYLSSGGCFICLLIFGMYFKAVELGKNVEYFSWVPLLSLVIYIIVYSFGFGSYTWVIIAEILHPSVKTFASALATSLAWFLSFVITRYFDAMVQTMGSSGTFWLFSVFCFIALIFYIFQLPDTQGKSFQEIQDMIGGKRCTIDDEELK